MGEEIEWLWGLISADWNVLKLYTYDINLQKGCVSQQPSKSFPSRTLTILLTVKL